MTTQRFAIPLLMVALIAGDALAASATTSTIEGIVVNAATNQFISGSSVQLLGSAGRTAIASTRSGADGRFEFGKLAAGHYLVAATTAGYQTVTKRVRVSHGKSVFVRIAMRAGRSIPPVPATQDSVEKEEEEKVQSSTRKYRFSGVPVRKMVRSKMIAGAMRAGSPAGYGRLHSIGMANSAPYRPGIKPSSREGYDHVEDNSFKSAKRTPLSTFSIDVDTASYSNIRRFIQRMGRLPPKDAVRIEELINYFPYANPGPNDGRPFAVHTELGPAPWNPKRVLARISVQGKRVDINELPPANLVFLLDVSGSMHSPDKLPLLKRSLAMLVSKMRPQDRVAITVYAGAAGVVLPSTSGGNQGRILSALDGLRAGGSTAGGAGIKLAYKIAQQHFIKGGNNRVILATDGDFNVGTSSDGALVRLIEDKRKSGVFLTVLGFGTGNYQDAKMQKLADKGNGNHAYIDSLLEARKVLVEQMGGTLLTIAKDVKIQVEFNPAAVKGYRLIGYVNRKLAARDFNDDKKDAGELGAGHSVTAFYELVPAGSSEKIDNIDPLRYQKSDKTAASGDGELMTVKLRYKKPTGSKSQLLTFAVANRQLELAQTSDDFRFASAVAELGMLLRKSKHKGQASYAAVRSRAQGALGQDTGGYRKAFVGMVDQVSRLDRGTP